MTADISPLGRLIYQCAVEALIDPEGLEPGAVLRKWAERDREWARVVTPRCEEILEKNRELVEENHELQRRVRELGGR